MAERGRISIMAFSYMGAIIGCLLAYLTVAEIVPEFNENFLTFKHFEKKDKELHKKDDKQDMRFFEILKNFQVATGILMITISIVSLIHTQCRFIALNEEDRE